jgi:hypothetical protein
MKETIIWIAGVIAVCLAFVIALPFWLGARIFSLWES